MRLRSPPENCSWTFWVMIERSGASAQPSCLADSFRVSCETSKRIWVLRRKPSRNNLLLKLLYGLATKIRHQMAWEEILRDSCAGMPGRISRVYVYCRVFLWRWMFVRLISFNYPKCMLFLNAEGQEEEFFFLKGGQLARILSFNFVSSRLNCGGLH